MKWGGEGGGGEGRGTIVELDNGSAEADNPTLAHPIDSFLLLSFCSKKEFYLCVKCVFRKTESGRAISKPRYDKNHFPTSEPTEAPHMVAGTVLSEW